MTAKLHVPSAERNCRPILDVLARCLPASGLVLEIASGSGQHAAAAAKRFAGIEWQPSDPDATARASINAWRCAAALPNLCAPLDIGVMADDWWRQIDLPVAAIISINMLHIAPWAACEGLMRGAGACLAAGDVLYCYGPLTIGGQHTAPSNAAFDAALRAREASWGVRDVDDVEAAASAHGIQLKEQIAMPANNLSLIFMRDA